MKEKKTFIGDIFDDIQEDIEEISSGISSGISDINRSLRDPAGMGRGGRAGGFLNRFIPKKRFTRAQLVQIRQKRKGGEYSAGALVSVMMAAAGAFLLMSPGSLVQHIAAGASAVIFGASGLALMVKMKRNVRKWDQYESLIRWTGNTPLAVIAEKTGKSIDQVSSDLQEMITRNFLIGPRGDLVPYIDREYDLLVMIDYYTGMPLESVEDYLEKIRSRERESRQARERESRKKDNVYMIRTAAGQVSDPQVQKILLRLADSLSRIEEKLERSPDLRGLPYIKKLGSAYIPNAMKLIGIYMNSSGNDEITERVKESLMTCARAFENIEEKLFDADGISIIADLDVMDATFKRDGLLDPDFDLG